MKMMETAKSDKRGQSLVSDKIIRYSLVIIGALIIIIVIGRLTPLYGETFGKGACQGSVAARAQLLQSGFIQKQLFSMPDIVCKTEYKCLTIGGTCPSGYDKVNVNNADDIKKYIADAMQKCFSEYGEGRLDFMGKELLRTNACGICSQIRFDDESVKKIKTLPGLSAYLGANKMPYTDKTYLQYISANPNVNRIGIDQNLDLSKEYDIVYAIYTGNYFSNLIGSGGGAVIGGAIGSIVPGAGTALGVIVGGSVGAWGGNKAVEDIKQMLGADQRVYTLGLIEHNPAELKKSCEKIISTA